MCYSIYDIWCPTNIKSYNLIISFTNTVLKIADTMSRYGVLFILQVAYDR